VSNGSSNCTLTCAALRSLHWPLARSQRQTLMPRSDQNVSERWGAALTFVVMLGPDEPPK
jgi:hypothetical protein